VCVCVCVNFSCFFFFCVCVSWYSWGEDSFLSQPPFLFFPFHFLLLLVGEATFAHARESALDLGRRFLSLPRGLTCTGGLSGPHPREGVVDGLLLGFHRRDDGLVHATTRGQVLDVIQFLHDALAVLFRPGLACANEKKNVIRKMVTFDGKQRKEKNSEYIIYVYEYMRNGTLERRVDQSRFHWHSVVNENTIHHIQHSFFDQLHHVEYSYILHDERRKTIKKVLSQPLDVVEGITRIFFFSLFYDRTLKKRYGKRSDNAGCDPLDVRAFSTRSMIFWISDRWYYYYFYLPFSAVILLIYNVRLIMESRLWRLLREKNCVPLTPRLNFCLDNLERRVGLDGVTVSFFGRGGEFVLCGILREILRTLTRD